MNRRDPSTRRIGLDRLVRLEWLERAAMLALAGSDATTARRTLAEELAPQFPNARPGARGSLDKTIGVLSRTWLRPSQRTAALAREGLQWMARLPRRQHLALHWGMLMAAYPFWGAVARYTGRLLALQGTVGAASVQRRMREQYGERETVARRVRYVLRSFVAWNVLRETNTPGLYAPGVSVSIRRAALVAWLVEAYLTGAPDRAASIDELRSDPALFPVRIGRVSTDAVVRARTRLDLVPTGLDSSRIVLAHGPAAPPASR